MTDDADFDSLKSLATHLSEQAVEGRRHLLDEHSASFRWLMASFLALNGGGLLSLGQLSIGDSRYALGAAASFFLGIVCALLIAFLGQKSNKRMIEPMSRMAIYWRSVAMSGTLDETIQSDLDARFADGMKTAKWPSRAGFASLVFFAAGLVLIAIGWTR